MKKKTARVTIALNTRNVYCDFEYDTLEDLVSSINELFTDTEISFTFDAGDATTITLPECDGGLNYKWNGTLAHYCFAHGRISVSDLVNEMFKEEHAL